MQGNHIRNAVRVIIIEDVKIFYVNIKIKMVYFMFV